MKFNFLTQFKIGFIESRAQANLKDTVKAIEACMVKKSVELMNNGVSTPNNIDKILKKDSECLDTIAEAHEKYTELRNRIKNPKKTLVIVESWSYITSFSYNLLYKEDDVDYEIKRKEIIKGFKLITKNFFCLIK
jgi:hypothetical protein